MSTSNPPTPEQRQALIEPVIHALNSGDQPRAIELARAALDQGVETALFLNLRAYWHELEGRFDQGFRDIERAYALDPEDAGAAHAFGLALMRLTRFREAAAIFSSVTTLAPHSVPPFLNLGLARERIGELEAAARAYEAAVALDPHCSPALGALAALAARRGDYAAVRRHANRALILAPTLINAHYALGLADLAENMAEAAAARARPSAEDGNLNPLDRAMMRGLLADALHQSNQYSEAFHWYRLAAADLAQGHRASFEALGQETAATYVWRMLGALNDLSLREPAHTHRFDPIPNGPSGHAFLLGFPRSGTTLLENVLAAHPQVRTSEEKEGFRASMRAFMLRSEGLAKLQEAPLTALEPYRAQYWQELSAQGADRPLKGGEYWIDKFPLNTIKLPLIARLFPEAKVIFAIRDPRDVVLICFRRRFTMNASLYEFTGLERTARFYDATMTFAMKARERFAVSLIETRYEDFVADFEAQARRIFSFLDLPWTDEVRDFADKAKSRAISTPSATQVTRGVYQDGQGQWRHYERELGSVMPILRPWIERFGYEV